MLKPFNKEWFTKITLIKQTQRTIDFQTIIYIFCSYYFKQKKIIQDLCCHQECKKQR